MGAAAIPILIASTAAVSASGQYQSGQAAKAAGQRQQELSNRAAASVLQAGEQEAARIRDEGVQLASRQRAGFASAGISLGSTSALDLISDTGALSELDALTARNNAAREAWGIREGGVTAAWEGKQRKRSATAASFGTLLGGAGHAIDTWRR